jgi:hypothetical protein
MSHQSYQLFLLPSAPSRSLFLIAYLRFSSATSTNFEAASTILAVHSATTPTMRGHSSPKTFSASDAATPPHTDSLSLHPSFCLASSTWSGFFSQLPPFILSSSRQIGSLARPRRDVIVRSPSTLSGSATRAENSVSMRSIQFDRTPNKRGAGKGVTAVLWRAGRAWPALPDRHRSVYAW